MDGAGFSGDGGNVNGRTNRLKLLIERSERCGGSLISSTRIHFADADGDLVWDGVVSTFDLHDHKDGIHRAYAWEIPATIRATQPKYHFVLGKPPINSQEDAVKAYIVAFYRRL
jgi:hypothetical protein